MLPVGHHLSKFPILASAPDRRVRTRTELTKQHRTLPIMRVAHHARCRRRCREQELGHLETCRGGRAWPVPPKSAVVMKMVGLATLGPPDKTARHNSLRLAVCCWWHFLARADCPAFPTGLQNDLPDGAGCKTQQKGRYAAYCCVTALGVEDAGAHRSIDSKIPFSY